MIIPALIIKIIPVIACNQAIRLVYGLTKNPKLAEAPQDNPEIRARMWSVEFISSLQFTYFILTIQKFSHISSASFLPSASLRLLSDKKMITPV